VHGAGYRYVGPVEASVFVPMESRARFGPPPTARLPARLHALIGREDELARMDVLLAGARALTVLGTGGMGKTQCALAFAHEHTEDYPDGVWFFDLAPLHQPNEWLQTLALTLSIAPSGEREMLAKVAQSLAHRRALLLLDNCDRLSGGVGALVVEILQGTERLKVLATSQQQLNFVGERVLRMPPLRLPNNRRPSGDAEITEVAAAPAVSLLVTRIRDSQPEFVLSAANAPAVIDICARLDGMPLALELAAARFALLSPEQVLERLDQRFRFLISDRAGRDRRHRNLVTLLDWSFKLLSPEEQRLLAWLGVFVQGWTVDAAVELASAFGATPEMTVDLMTGLVNKSLVSVDQSVSPPRYRLLESVREFALEQLATLQEVRRARDAHLAYVLRMTEAAHKDMLEGRMRERIVMLMQEHGNIDRASEYAVAEANDRQAALRIAGLLMLYIKAHGAHVLGKRLCERALTDPLPARTRERGMALMCRGVNEVMGDKVAPENVLLEAVSVAREVGDHWTAAYSSGFLAMWLIHSGRPEEAVEHCCAVELAAVAALETVDVAVCVAPAAAAPRPPRPASSPEAPSIFESSGGSAAEMALFWLLSSERIADGSDQLEGSCWPIVPTATCVTAPSSVCVAGWGAPEYWLSAPARLERPPPPSRPLRRLPPSLRNLVLPPDAACPILVRISGSELEIASDTFWAPPGAAAAVPSAARIVGTAAATTFCATASLTPSARARLPTICGVRNWDTRLTRLIAIEASPQTNKVRPAAFYQTFGRLARFAASEN